MSTIQPEVNSFTIGQRVWFIKGVQRGSTLHLQELVGTIDSFIREGASVKYRGRFYYNSFKCLNQINKESLVIGMCRAIADAAEKSKKEGVKP